LRGGAGPWSPRLVAGASGPDPGVCQSAADSWRARPASDASTGRTDRTLLRASLRHRWDAPHASARPHQYPQAPADSCGGLQSRARHAPRDRPRHAARAAGSPGDRHGRTFGALGRYPTLAGRDFRMAPTHGGGALVSVTDHHHWQLLSGDHLHHGLLACFEACGGADCGCWAFAATVMRTLNANSSENVRRLARNITANGDEADRSALLKV